MTNLVQVLDCCSPIGFIPPAYPHLDELCRKAHIGFEDETILTTTRKLVEKVKDPSTGLITENIVSKEERTMRRRWFITYDEKLRPAKRRTASGRIKLDYGKMQYATTEHMKFCAILDFIKFRAHANMRDMKPGELDRVNVFNVAIGKETGVKMPDGTALDLGKKISELRAKDWSEVSNELESVGVHGYERKGKQESSSEESMKKASESLPF